MHKRAFQGLKRTFMHVLKLPLYHVLIKKPIYKVIGFFNQNLVEEELRHE